VKENVALEEMEPLKEEPAAVLATAKSEPAIKSGLLRALAFLGAQLVWMGLFGIVAGMVIVLGAGRLDAVEHTMDTDLGRAMEAGGMIGVLLLVLLFRKVIDRRSFVSLGFSFDDVICRDLVAGMALGAGLITTVFTILYAAGALSIESIQFPTKSVVVFAVLLTLVAVEEEAVCRGYILINVMQSMNKYLALIFVSLLFSMLHLLNPNPSVIGYVNIVLAGLLLGIYYVHKRSLWFPIGLHLTWNFFQGIVYGSPVSGVRTPSILTLSFADNDLLTGGKFGFEASLVTTAATLAAILLVHLVYRNRAVRAGGGDIQRCQTT